MDADLLNYSVIDLKLVDIQTEKVIESHTSVNTLTHRYRSLINRWTTTYVHGIADKFSTQYDDAEDEILKEINFLIAGLEVLKTTKKVPILSADGKDVILENSDDDPEKESEDPFTGVYEINFKTEIHVTLSPDAEI